jgi:hypothetical protein
MSRWTWTALLVVAVLLVGCGAAATSQPAGQATGSEPFMLALPRIVVNVDDAGNLSFLGLSAATFGMDVKLPKSLVDTLVSGNVQHVEVRIIGSGLILFANGKPLPHIGWDDQALAQTADLAQVFTGQDVSTIKKLLPIVRRLGLDVALRLPKKPGAADIPMISMEEGGKVVAQPSGGPATAVVKMDVKIDDQGQPSILDLTAQDLAQLGMAMPAVLDGDTLKRIQAANIQHAYVRSQPGVLNLYANGKPLLHLIWDSRMLANAAELFGQLQPDSPYREVAKMILPGLEQADIDVLVYLPKAAGAQAVPPPQR